MKAIRHFQTITKHKIYVMRECFRVGLYRQGLLHDLSKYSWTEFRIGCRYYQGTRSPNNAEREEKGYSSAWLHHKGRNKHHYEYWIDYNVNAGKDVMIQIHFCIMKMEEQENRCILRQEHCWKNFCICLQKREKKKLTGTSAGKYSERKKADYGIVCCPAWGNGLE